MKNQKSGKNHGNGVRVIWNSEPDHGWSLRIESANRHGA